MPDRFRLDPNGQFPPRQGRAFGQSLKPSDLSLLRLDPEEFSLWELNRYIRDLRQKGLDPGGYIVDRDLKYAMPLACLIMVALGIALSLDPLPRTLVSVAVSASRSRSASATGSPRASPHHWGVRIYSGLVRGLGPEPVVCLDRWPAFCSARSVSEVLSMVLNTSRRKPGKLCTSLNCHPEPANNVSRVNAGGERLPPPASKRVCELRQESEGPARSEF